jgi:hypothetical protein
MEFEESVRNKIGERGEPELIDLWSEIYKCYKEGGPDSLQNLINGKLKELRKGVKQEVDGIKEVIPKKRKKRRR